MTDFAFKSTLVVWTGDESPAVETFYGMTEDEVSALQEQWMADGNHTVANMHLYRRVDGDWVSVDTCLYQRMPALPEFVWLSPAEQEPQSVHDFLQGSLLQTSTGRVVRVRPKDMDDGQGLYARNIVYELPQGQLTFTADLIRPAEGDLDMMAFHYFESLEAVLGEELFTPLSRWLVRSSPAR